MSAEAAIIYGLCAIGLALLAGASAGVGPQQPSGISPFAFRLLNGDVARIWRRTYRERSWRCAGFGPCLSEGA